MKWKAAVNKTQQLARCALLPLAALLLFVLLCKQIGIYPRIVTIYHSLLPVVMGILIAFLFQPLIDRLQRRFSLRTSVMIVYVGIFLIFVLIVIGLVPILYRQLVDFAKVAPRWMKKLEAFLTRYHIAIESFATMKEKYLQQGYLIVIDSLKTTMDTLTRYGIAYITAFFISADMDFWKRTAKKVVPDVQRFSTFYLTMSTIVYQYLMGTFLDLLFITVTVGLTLSIFQFPNAMLYAIILALLNLFPYIGATFGLILIAIVGALSYADFPFIAFAIVWSIQQIESNIIQPMIFNRTMHVRPILTFVFIFISEAFFGVVGVILSPIFAAIAQIAFRSWLHARTSDEIGQWEEIWQDFDEAMREEPPH